MNVLITGGAGFIGSHLAEMHLRRGDKVKILDDLSTGNQSNIDYLDSIGPVEFHHGDVVTWSGLPGLVREVDRVYHMAAVVGMFRVLKEPVGVTRVNVLGTERVLEAATHCSHPPQIVIPSSSSVYGSAPYDQLHEAAEITCTPGAPLLNYALSKFTNEVQGGAYFHEHKVPVILARLFNTIGRRQQGLYGFVVPRFVQQALRGAPITVFGRGTQTRSFCDVRDTCQMLDALASTPLSYGTPVNVGNTQEITILELARKVKRLCQSSSDISFIPYEKAYGKAFAQIPQRRPILAKLDHLTGYRHQWVLDETIRDLRHYYEQLASPTIAVSPAMAPPLAPREVSHEAALVS